MDKKQLRWFRKRIRETIKESVPPKIYAKSNCTQCQEFIALYPHMPVKMLQ